MNDSTDTRVLASRPAVEEGVYTLCYYLAFAAVYSGHLALGLLPADSIVHSGLRDGADSARKAWARANDGSAESEMGLPGEVAEVIKEVGEIAEVAAEL